MLRLKVHTVLSLQVQKFKCDFANSHGREGEQSTLAEKTPLTFLT